MSKKLKAFICAITAGMMLTTSLGLTAFAEELNADGSAATETVLNADGSEAKATETPETVNGADVAEDEADAARLADIESSAEVTPEPTEEPKSYDDDTYYNNALKVCSALGIITGYDDGSVKPEATVTRAEMATIILRMIANAGTSAYQNVFTDVTDAHWAADTIQTAVEQNIVNGMGDGTFVPDGPVKYEQVIKMIVCAMNYGTDAENAGGYPQGYLAVGGSTLKLLTGVNGASGEDMPRGEVIKSVYNALKASYRGIKEFKNGYPVYETRDTLGIEKFDMYEEEGVLTTTPNITIASGSKTKKGVITIDGVDYKCDFNVDEYVATKVKFYYIDDKSDDNKVIAMFSMGRSVENTFDAKDIDIIETSGSNPVIKAYSSESSSTTKTYKIKDATFVYNDTIITTALFAQHVDTSLISFDEFLKPAVGSIKIVDYDNDGFYDIVFVDSYETMLVTSATSEKLNGKIYGVNTTIEYDLDDSAYEIHVTKNDVAASVKNLRKNDVASIKRNLAGDKLTIVVTGESVTGSVTAVGTEDNEMTATINGQVYKVDVNAASDIKTGIAGTFYLDKFDRVGYASLNGALSENESYAYIEKAYYNDENELVIRLYTQEGADVEAKPSGSIRYWAPNASSSTKSPGETQLYKDLSSDANYVQCGSQPVKLCKYTINTSGEISKLYVATGIENVSESEYNDALVIYTRKNTDETYSANLRNVPAVGGTLNGYTINDGITGFMVPNTASDRGSGSNYTVSAITASRYKDYDGGVDHDFAIGGFTTGSTKSAQILVEFSTSSTSMYDITELDTASIRPVLIVSKINEAVDSEGEKIYVVKGYQAGAEVSYTTKDTSSCYKFTGWNTSSRKYTGTLLFDATHETADTELTEVLKEGDIVAVAADGTDIRSMVIMTAAADVAKMAVTGKASGLVQIPAGSSASGATRQTYYMGFVSSAEIDDSAFIGLKSYDDSATGSVTYNASSVFSYVTLAVDETGKIINTKVDKNGGMEPSELYAWGDDPDAFDYFLCSSLKGSMSNGYVIRVEIKR